MGLGVPWLVASAQVLSSGLGEPQPQASGRLVGASRGALQLAAVKRWQLLPSRGHESGVPAATLTTREHGEPERLSLSWPVPGPPPVLPPYSVPEASHPVPPALRGTESKVCLLRGVLSRTLWTFKDHLT